MKQLGEQFKRETAKKLSYRYCTFDTVLLKCVIERILKIIELFISTFSDAVNFVEKINKM